MTTAFATKPKKASLSVNAEHEERKFHKPDASKVQKDHLMALTYYVKVKDVRIVGEKISVEGVDEGVGMFDVNGRVLIENALSADQFAEEVILSKTKVCEILVSSYNRPLTVCFLKKDGSERILRGRLVAPEPLFGRSIVEDLDLEKTDKEPRIREVTHLNVKWLIVDGVKYTVKS